MLSLSLAAIGFDVLHFTRIIPNFRCWTNDHESGFACIHSSYICSNHIRPLRWLIYVLNENNSNEPITSVSNFTPRMLRRLFLRDRREGKIPFVFIFNQSTEKKNRFGIWCLPFIPFSYFGAGLLFWRKKTKQNKNEMASSSQPLMPLLTWPGCV